MAHYLVRARVRGECLDELAAALRREAFLAMKPFGRAITHGLRNARRETGGVAMWEEEDYCSPPLAQERDAVLDRYFTDIDVEPVARGEGWKRIADLPPLFPSLSTDGFRNRQ